MVNIQKNVLKSEVNLTQSDSVVFVILIRIDTVLFTKAVDKCNLNCLSTCQQL